MLTRLTLLLACLTPALVLLPRASSRAEEEQLFAKDLAVNPPPLASDKTVKYDYDIVYVRAPRKGDRGRTIWTEIAHPAMMDPVEALTFVAPAEAAGASSAPPVPWLARVSRRYEPVACNACYYACRGEAQAPLRFSRIADVFA